MLRGHATLRGKPAGCFIHAVIASEAMQFKGRKGEWGASRSSTPRGKSCPICGRHGRDFPRIRCTSNSSILVHLIGGKFARSVAANGGELASGCTSSPLRAAPLHNDAGAIARKCFQTRSIIAKRMAVPHTGWRSNG